MSDELLETARRVLLPMLADLVAQLGMEGPEPAHAFFRGIHAQLDAAHSEADLADPFMSLVMSADIAQRFPMSPEATFLVDRVLAEAHSFASTLAAETTEH